MSILVTGGVGYIGSHTVVELLNAGEKVIIIDNFSNSKKKTLDAIKKITNKDFKFYEIDYLDRKSLEKVFEENKDIDSVINFAGYKAVGESVQKPIEYYINNISGALVLLDTMKKYNVKKFVFSSSATVYGEPEKIPLNYKELVYITPTIEDKPTVENTVIKSEPVEAKTSETNSIETQIQELKHLKDLGVLTEEQYKDAYESDKVVLPQDAFDVWVTPKRIEQNKKIREKYVNIKIERGIL